MKDIYGVDITREKLSVSQHFKLWTLSIVSLLVIIQILQETRLKEQYIIPPTVILISVLVAIVYLWLQEARDRSRFQNLSTKLALAQSELLETNLDAIMALVAAEEESDPYTKNHSKRVTDYALTLAKKLNLSKDQLEIIKRAGLLHDIGKIGSLRGIINKPGKLTYEEWAEIKKHPDKGVM